MSYYSELGATRRRDHRGKRGSSEPPPSRAPAPGAPPSRAGSSEKGDRDRRTQKKSNTTICAETGMPSSLISKCRGLLDSGMSIEQAISSLQREEAMPVAMPRPVSRSKNLLVYGSIGVGVLAVLYFVMKGRRQ